MLNTLLKHCDFARFHEQGKAFANTNIALIKYWGKRDRSLNLPVTDSLSLGLPGLGTKASVCIIDKPTHSILINEQTLTEDHPAFAALNHYLNQVSELSHHHYQLNLQFNIPVAAGFASSASCYASIALAFNALYQWELSTSQLSIMARLGSGSAARSIESGFCEWHAGTRDDGMDSYAEKLPYEWPELCLGLLHIDNAIKPRSSREGMLHTQDTSFLYESWPKQVSHDLSIMHEALASQDFQLMGETAEHNAESMHACMQSAKPALIYSQAETLVQKKRIIQARHDGLALYYTQDAGPNLKCLFLNKDRENVLALFPTLNVLQPFASDS